MGLTEEIIEDQKRGRTLRGLQDDAPLDPRRDDRPTWLKIAGAAAWVYIAYRVIVFLI
jgi:hypothetical protein